MTSPSLNADAESLLRTAGWLPGRNAAEPLDSWQSALAAEGFVLHSVAKTALLEFGGLLVGSAGPGIDRARSQVQFDPTLAVGERDRLQEYFEELRERSVYPLGEVDDGNAFVAIAEDGEVFLVGDEVYDRWPSLHIALESLLLGIRVRAV